MRVAGFLQVDGNSVTMALCGIATGRNVPLKASASACQGDGSECPRTANALTNRRGNLLGKNMYSVVLLARGREDILVYQLCSAGRYVSRCLDVEK
jgi:hypothetical protein